MSKNKEAGFTLIEAVAAMLVLVFGLLGIANLFAVATRSNMVGNQTTATAAVASHKLEELKSVPFDDPTIVPGGDLDNDVAGYFDLSTYPGTGTVRTRWRIENMPGDTQTLYIIVRSEFTYKNAAGKYMGLLTSRSEFTTFRTCTDIPLGCPGRIVG